MKHAFKKTAQKMTVAMGIFSSFFTPQTQAEQANVQQVMQEIKQTSDLLLSQAVTESYFFSVLDKLSEKVVLLNGIVRAMKNPEQAVQELTFIDTGLNTLAKLIRDKHLDFLKNHPQGRNIFKKYTAEVFKFSVFTEKMREKTNHYAVVVSQSGFTHSDLNELVANAQARNLCE